MKKKILSFEKIDLKAYLQWRNQQTTSSTTKSTTSSTTSITQTPCLNGDVVPLDEESIKHLNLTINQFASEALRTLCLGYMELEDGFAPESAMPASGYTCIGIVGIKDPVRPGVKESVAICRAAGITVRMVTEDNINTAKAIAGECGILIDDGITIEGPDFREKSLEELIELIPKIQVMDRCSPLDKHILVKHLRTTLGEVVAVTGDGTNDAPALQEEDIGLAMGIAGTEVCLLKWIKPI